MSDYNNIAEYWWDLPKDGNRHETIFSIVRFLDSNQGATQQGNLRNMRLYGNLNVLGLSVNTYSQTSSVNQGADKLSYNLIKSVIDTLTNKIAKNKIKLTFLTNNGDYSLKKKAKLLDKFCQGLFYKTEWYKKAPIIFRDAAIFGTGIVKIFEQDGEIKIERVFPDELKVDNNETYYGTARNIYQTKFMPREVLAKIFPKFKAEISTCPRADTTLPQFKSISNEVMVTEAWHLPSGKGKKDGRHIVSIANADFIDEPYTKDHFPFVFYRLNPKVLGFWGCGAAEELTPIQVEINKLLRTAQLGFHLAGVPKYLIENGSKIVKSHVNNEVGGLIYYTGTKPDLSTPNPINPMLLQQIESLKNDGYAMYGISQLSAASKKPAGLDSGKALREFNDIESERFILSGQLWEQTHLEIAQHCIELAKDLYEKNGKYEVKHFDRRNFISRIDWSDIDMREDDYVMQVFPTSFLSQTPSGRLQDVQDYIQAGFIDQKNALRLLDFPDLDQYVSMAIAGVEDIEATIEKIIDNGEYTSPEPFQDLVTGIKMCQSAYLRAKNDQVEEANLELLRRWIEEANRLMEQANPVPTLPSPDMMAAAPPANPLQAPVSPLLPNVNQ